MSSESIQRPPFDPAELAAALADHPDLSLELHPSAASSNALAAARAQEGAPEGLLVVVDHQSAGRGRLDRTWETPPGAAVTFSLVLRPTAPAASWPWLPLLTGHNVAKALAALGFAAGVKWPNDVLIADRKVSGILVERIDTPQGPAAIVGVGINVATTAEELPVATATSLTLAAPDGNAPDRTTVLVRVVSAIREAYDVWEAGGVSATQRLRASYAENSVTVGAQVRVSLPGGGVLEGRASDVDPDGRLVVDTPNGVERVGAGDVVHVRAAGGSANVASME